MEPLNDEVIRVAVRENARIAAVRSGLTDPDVRAVANYHRVRSILMGLAMGEAGQRFLNPGNPSGAATGDEIAAVERQREDILRSDPMLARMLSAIEARRINSTSVDRPKPAETPATTRPGIGYQTAKGKPHYFRVKTIAQVWQRLERFFRGCTDADPLLP